MLLSDMEILPHNPAPIPELARIISVSDFYRIPCIENDTWLSKKLENVQISFFVSKVENIISGALITCPIDGIK